LTDNQNQHNEQLNTNRRVMALFQKPIISSHNRIQPNTMSLAPTKCDPLQYLNEECMVCIFSFLFENKLEDPYLGDFRTTMLHETGRTYVKISLVSHGWNQLLDKSLSDLKGPLRTCIWDGGVSYFAALQPHFDNGVSGGCVVSIYKSRRCV
jgi:hypothetical protein